MQTEPTGQREMDTPSSKLHTAVGPPAVHSTSEQRESTQHPPVILSPQLLNVGKSLSFKGSHFHLLVFCSLPLVAERLMRPDKNITLTSCEGVPSLGCNSMILKLFKLLYKQKVETYKISKFHLCYVELYIYIYTHIFLQ